MLQDDVKDLLNSSVALELMSSDIPARMAYTGTDGAPRVVPVGAEVRSLYKQMARITITPQWAKLLDFETTLPSDVARLVREREQQRRA